jgi:predicted amidophosphoribosyltransferase
VTDGPGRLTTSWATTWRTLLGAAVDVVVPPRCVACAEPLERVDRSEGAGAWCDVCAEGLQPAPRPGLFLYVGGLATLIQRAKYSRELGAAHALARLMADRLDTDALGPIDVVTFVPAHWSRALWRGFDLPALLADAVAVRLGRPRVSLLTVRRRDPRLAQTSSREQRQQLVAGRFGCARAAAGRRVLLIDDVHTTGATLGAAALALRGGGASVVPRTLALTPDDGTFMAIDAPDQ